MRPLTDPAFLADRRLAHAVVLGGSGFIGAPLVRRLDAAGVRVTCLVHRSPGAVPSARALHGSVERFGWRALEDDLPDVVFHLARIAGRGAVTRARNRLASERLLAWLAGLARPPLLVYVGGTLAYGSRGDAEVGEDTPLLPTSFARDYLSGERPWLRARQGSDAPVVIARPAWVLGPGSWFEAFYRRFMRAERAVPLYGDGQAWMSIVPVDDCAGLLVRAARAAPPGTVVNVFAGPPIRQVELAERLARLSGLPVRRVSLDDLERRAGRPVREAFDFSARITTLHRALHDGTAAVNLDGSLAALL